MRQWRSLKLGQEFHMEIQTKWDIAIMVIILNIMILEELKC